MSGPDFADFYAISFSRVSAAARAFCADADVAYEATQEAFARCYSKWSRLSQEEWLEGWVTTTALNLTRRHFRRPTLAISTSPHELISDSAEAHFDLLAAVRTLPDRQRQAVVLYYLMDLPVAGVAELMHLSEGAVKSHLHKARASLRTSLEVTHG